MHVYVPDQLKFFLYECLFVQFACLSTDLTEKYEIPGDKIIDDKDFLSWKNWQSDHMITIYK